MDLKVPKMAKKGQKWDRKRVTKMIKQVHLSNETAEKWQKMTQIYAKRPTVILSYNPRSRSTVKGQNRPKIPSIGAKIQCKYF